MPTSQECVSCYEYKEVLAIKNEYDGMACVRDHSDFSAVCLNINSTLHTNGTDNGIEVDRYNLSREQVKRKVSSYFINNAF